MKGAAAAGAGERAESEARATLEHARALTDEFVAFLSSLARVESPTDRPETIEGVLALLAPPLEELGYEVRRIRGRTTGDHLYARPRARRRGAPAQLLVGHTDTVWPLGTLERMPVRVVDGRLHGPGTLDMKGGLAMMLFALRILRAIGREPEVTPVLFINADEETGSPDSEPWVRRLARAVDRALILEPAMGADGLVKTARKGVGNFDVIIHGRAAHAGLEPDRGVSAIVELSHVIQRLQALGDPERGTTVNVGVVSGGTRTNVIAPVARAGVDVRVTSIEDGRRVEEAVAAIEPTLPGARIEVSGGVRVPPLERTPRNRALWEQVRAAGGEVGLDLRETMAGGGSDGNTTSLFTATVDGLGCIGDGAHADHEHIVIEPTMERCALLARLLLAPAPAAGAERR